MLCSLGCHWDQTNLQRAMRLYVVKPSRQSSEEFGTSVVVHPYHVWLKVYINRCFFHLREV